MGSVKETGIKIAIKKIKDYDVYLLEKGILSDIRWIGNFSEFYDSIEVNDNYYVVESLNGPSLELLLSICDGKFDLFTTLNIGIDVFTNLEILHKLGYLHRDLKPTNLFFGSLRLKIIYYLLIINK